MKYEGRYSVYHDLLYKALGDGKGLLIIKCMILSIR